MTSCNQDAWADVLASVTGGTGGSRLQVIFRDRPSSSPTPHSSLAPLSTSQGTMAHDLTKRFFPPSSHLSKSLFGYLVLLGSRVPQRCYWGQWMLQMKDLKQEERSQNVFLPDPNPSPLVHRASLAAAASSQRSLLLWSLHWLSCPAMV